MSDYERLTALSLSEVRDLTHQALTGRAELELQREEGHERLYAGPEGTVHVEAHRHGPVTQVTIRTDRLRTSKVDGVVRWVMNRMPYQPGDPERA
jgi:hypothetical protein